MLDLKYKTIRDIGMAQAAFKAFEFPYQEDADWQQQKLSIASEQDILSVIAETPKNISKITIDILAGTDHGRITLMEINKITGSRAMTVTSATFSQVEVVDRLYGMNRKQTLEEKDTVAQRAKDIADGVIYAVRSRIEVKFGIPKISDEDKPAKPEDPMPPSMDYWKEKFRKTGEFQYD